MTLPLPDIYEDRFDEIYLARKEQIAEEAPDFSDRHDIEPARSDNTKRAIFGIDCQNDFVLPDRGALGVPGAPEDMKRMVKFIYRHLRSISGIQMSMDTHRAYQIFHASFWEDDDGNHPDPMTTITTEDLDDGTWRPVAHPKLAREYVEKIDASDHYRLTIWPYHTLLGGIGHALSSPVFEAALFHSIARSHQTHLETKGTKMLTEHFSVLEPEVKELGGKPIGSFSTDFYNTLIEYDKVGIFGEASSHCVKETILSLMDRIEDDDPSLAEKIYIFEGCMSPVQPSPPGVDFAEEAEQVREDAADFGCNIVSTDDPGDFLD